MVEDTLPNLLAAKKLGFKIFSEYCILLFKFKLYFMNINQIPTIIIAGPTASGKTCFSIELAKHINGEIINADAMQLYSGFNILKATEGWYSGRVVDPFHPEILKH